MEDWLLLLLKQNMKGYIFLYCLINYSTYPCLKNGIIIFILFYGFVIDLFILYLRVLF